MCILPTPSKYDNVLCYFNLFSNPPFLGSWCFTVLCKNDSSTPQIPDSGVFPYLKCLKLYICKWCIGLFCEGSMLAPSPTPTLVIDLLFDLHVKKQPSSNG